MSAVLERQHFQISRDSEYFSRNELQAQTGQAASAFFHVLLKELVDNALDAAETAGRPPEVGIEIYFDDELHLVVTDNGNGISLGVVAKILDFRTRTSDKAAYRAPTRGAQGNALKTIIGIPVALGADQSNLVIEAQGIRHRIAAWLDPAGAVRLEHETEDVETIGTRITVSIPNHEWLHFRPMVWVFDYAALNPHSVVKIRTFENGIMHAKQLDDESVDFYPSDPAWPHFLPTDPTVPHWYDADSFARLVQLSIYQNDTPLRVFVRQFRGLKGTAKAKVVCRAVEAERLIDLDGDRGSIDRLHKAMIREASELKPELLGIIGADHWQKQCDPRSPERFWYKRIKSTGTLPFVVEAALAETKNPRVVAGVNFSPSYGDPLSSTRLSTPEFTTQGLGGFLLRCEATMDYGFTAIIHIVGVGLHFLDRGKTRLNASPELAEACAEALWSVCKTAYKEMKARERDRAKAERDAEPSQKEIVFECLPEALAHATGNGQYSVSPRTLYYSVRHLFSKQSDKDLDFNYFSQGLLTDYQAEHGKIDWLYYDPRGWLYEPHTGREIQLGTREVEQYEIPSWRYDKLLYVEKKGLWPILKQAQIAERYDMAIVCAEGFATTAARTLFAKAQKQHQYQLFVLHDCDPDGYNIARTLAESTKRMPEHRIDVVDLGLKLETARALPPRLLYPLASLPRRTGLGRLLTPIQLDRVCLAIPVQRFQVGLGLG